MARGVNKVILIGNLGRTPEIRYTSGGMSLCTVSLATSVNYRNRETKEKVEKVDWHRLVFFGRLAEIVSEYLDKGSCIYVEGRLQTREWQDQQTNEKRYMTEVVVNEMQMLDRRGGSSRDEDYNREARPVDADESDKAGGPAEPGGYDDDIPF